jgi:hypothetical protein
MQTFSISAVAPSWGSAHLFLSRPEIFGMTANIVSYRQVIVLFQHPLLLPTPRPHSHSLHPIPIPPLRHPHRRRILGHLHVQAAHAHVIQISDGCPCTGEARPKLMNDWKTSCAKQVTKRHEFLHLRESAVKAEHLGSMELGPA